MLALVLAAAGLVLRRRITQEVLDRTVFLFGIFFFLLEAYKQAYYHAVLGGGTFQVSVLPLQLCSYILYLALLIPILPEGRIKDALYCFAGLYETVGGVVVMAYPLFYRELSLSVHTMLWHTAMVAVGVLILAVRGYGRSYTREVLPSLGIFLGIFAVGLSLNVILSPDRAVGGAPLNLFYLSPYGVTNMFLIGDVRDALGLPMAAATYAFLLLLGVSALWLLGRLVHMGKSRTQRKGGNSDEKRIDGNR